MLLPTLQALDVLGGSGTKDEIDEAVVRLMALTEDQLAIEYPLDAKQKGSKVIHRVAWARSYLKKLATIDNTQRGVWTLEPPGRAYLAMEQSEAQKAIRVADAEIRRQDRVARLARGDESKPLEGSGSDRIVLQDLGDAEGDGRGIDGEEEWTDRLLRRLLSLSPSAFERLTQRLLREAGFKNVEVTGKSGDGGLDGVGVYRPSLISFPIFFQCKRYASSVGPGMVRDFRGAMAGRGEKGLLITTGTFTAEAKRESTRDGAPPVELIDGQDLCALLKEFSVGVTTKTIERVDVDESFFDDI